MKVIQRALSKDINTGYLSHTDSSEAKDNISNIARSYSSHSHPARPPGMPRDDSGPIEDDTSYGNGLDNNGKKATLRRGDACLYCRKRRIKCSADKPSCQHCKKLQRECVYDNGKPVSRVKQLEDKVAELEELLKTGVTPPAGAGTQSRRESVSANGANESFGQNASTSTNQPPPFVHHSSSEQSGQASVGSSQQPYGESFNGASGYQQDSVYGYTNVANGVSQGSNAANSATTIQPPSRTSAGALDGFDWSTLDPSFMDLVKSLGSTSTEEPTAYQSQSQSMANQSVNGSVFQQNGIQQLYSENSGMGPFASSSTAFPPIPNPATTNGEDRYDRMTPEEYATAMTTKFLSSTLPDPLSMLQSQPSVLSNLQSPGSAAYHAYVMEVVDESSPSANNSTSTPSSQRENGSSSRTNGTTLDRDMRGQGGVCDEIKNATGGGQDYTAYSSTYDTAAWEPADGKDLVGGWFDAADLPKVARDHLLDIFFAGIRNYELQIHIPRFFASLALQPAKRPHSSLLYAMYTVAAKRSSSAAIKALEPHFYEIAIKRLRESISQSDRLIDSVRASSILAVYEFSCGRYHEGWMQTGEALRLAVSCGLHAIPSNVFKASSSPADHRADLVGLMRKKSFMISPPEDAIELGERIWAFWAVYVVERASAIATQWPCAIIDECITTPFPRPLYEYELGLISSKDDLTLAPLYDMKHPYPPLPHYVDATLASIRMRSMSILERASKLIYLRPEGDWYEKLKESSISPSALPSVSPPTLSGASWAEDILSYDQYMNYLAANTSTSQENSPFNPEEPGQDVDMMFGLAGSSNASNAGTGVDGPGLAKTRGWMRTAKIRTPKAFEEIKCALLKAEEHLAPERRTDWDSWDGRDAAWYFDKKARMDLFAIHFVLGCAWMFLYDVFSFNTPNDKAVTIARRLTSVIKVIMNEHLFADLDAFMPMAWSFIVKTLIREVKRLQAIGDIAAAGPIEVEVETVYQALKIFGQRYNLATEQADRTMQYKASKPEDFKFMEDLSDSEDEVPGKIPNRAPSTSAW